ncbi:diacylglycerol kinase family protein [uncultured Ruthenibacterium sp.]|uniref:diacylglycerol/lipid kinase family protein n=1 Tax=uncultured Ruthenibacterium sp. TaxID=1905347 RepID=UPI00349E9AF4
MEHIFVVNPVSGKADASLHLVPQIIEQAKKCGVSYRVEITQSHRHAVDLAYEYARAAEQVRIYACGGDGTLNEVLEGVLSSGNSKAEVASVPCGSGNDYVRNFGKLHDFLNLQEQIKGTAIPVDLMRTSKGISAAICSVGIDAKVAYNIPKYRRIPFCGGSMAYNLSIAENLCRPIGQLLRVEIDDKVFEDEFLIATVCNGSYYGGGFRAAPSADLQDGILDVILVRKMSRLRIAGVLSKYKEGRHIDQDGMVVPDLKNVMLYFRAQEVHIAPVNRTSVIINVDGECEPASRLDAIVMPKAANFVLPNIVWENWKRTRNV